MAEYFSHDVDARNDVKVSQLIQAHGYAGYGLYWAVIELMNQQTDCQLPYDLKWLTWELHAPAKTLERVLKDFGLFVFSEDKRFFWSESARKRLAMRLGAVPTVKKRGRPPKTPKLQPEAPEVSTADNESAPISLQNDVDETKSEDCSPMVEDVVQNATETVSETVQQDSQNSQDETEQFPDFGIDGLNVEEQILSYWNEVFKGTNRVQRGLCLSAEASHRLRKTLEAGYTVEEVQKAINAARRDSFEWYLPAVLKEDNVQLLLNKGTKNGANDITAGKQFHDSNGVPCQPGGEFASPEYWNAVNASVEATPF